MIQDPSKAVGAVTICLNMYKPHAVIFFFDISVTVSYQIYISIMQKASRDNSYVMAKLR